jgi:glycosyltransferase involved in cell wall biosynthesis
LCGEVDAAAVSASQDREAIGDLAHVHVVPNGVDTALFPFAEPAERPARVVFVGNLGYFPNVDAAGWFARQVLPLVVAARPGVTLSLVGARPARAVRQLARRDPHVTLVGPVPEVRSHLAAAAVAVAPLRAGSGQQLKILEAMAAGTPVVATTTAAAGLEAVPGEHLLVADDPAAFSAHVVRLLDDSSLRVAMARRARRLVEERYSWERSARDLEALWWAAAGSTP